MKHSFLRRLSQAAFGTDSLIEGLERQADELAATPKSVSGMTRIFEPQIQRDFPDFHLEQFKKQAEDALLAALQGNETERYEQVHIYQTEIANYIKSQGRCVITFQSAVSYFYYKEIDGKITAGNKERREQTKYNIEMAYIQDEKQAGADNAFGTTCPSCGAPVTNLGAMYCEYCGLAVTPVNHKVWSVLDCYEVDYHHV